MECDLCRTCPLDKYGLLGADILKTVPMNTAGADDTRDEMLLVAYLKVVYVCC